MILGELKRDDRDEKLVGNLRKFYPVIFRSMEDDGCRFSQDKFRELLDRGVREGMLLPALDRDMAVLTLTYMLTSVFEHQDQFQVEGEKVFRYIAVNFFRGLATHKGIETIDELVVKYRK
jgi:hypothetical protein